MERASECPFHETMISQAFLSSRNEKEPGCDEATQAVNSLHMPDV